MTRNPKISPGLRGLAVGLLGTTAALTLGLPQEAQAQTISGSYGYSYQQITGLRAFFTPLPTINFGSNTVGSGSVAPGGTLALADIFDTPEAYVGPPASGANAGLGNNFGFFSNPPLGNFTGRTGGSSQKGQVTPDYARGDAQIQTTNLGDIFTSTGLNFANVAESYINSALGPTSDPNFLTTQGNGVGRYVVSSNNFNLSSSTNVSFLFNYRNELYAELGQDTPAGAPLGNQANASYDFNIVINEIVAGGGTTEVFRFAPEEVNFSVGLIEEGIANGGAFQGTISSLDVLHECNSMNNQGVCTLNPGTYQLQITGEEKVDTRIVKAAPPVVMEIPEPTSALALLGFGSLGLVSLRGRQKAKG